MSKKKVAIIGFAPTWVDAPFDDKDCQIWTVNSLHHAAPRTDRIFELHKMQTLKRLESECLKRNDVLIKDHLDWLKKNTEIPVYMVDEYPEIPAAVRYPLEEMIAEFGLPRIGRDEVDGYFTNSISFMMALAIHEGFEEMHVYGVDMAANSEYGSQRPSCEYYLGIARGKGIKIVMPVEADLLKSRHIYGYEEEKEDKFMAKLNQMVTKLDERKKNAEAERDRCSQVVWQYDGALASMKEVKTLWE